MIVIRVVGTYVLCIHRTHNYNIIVVLNEILGIVVDLSTIKKKKNGNLLAQ